MTQQDDITQRLRDNADLDEAEHGNARVVQLERDAANEIERLRAELSKLRAPVADERHAVDPCGYVAVKRSAVDWLKDKFPALTIKAGLCERIGGRLYTITRLMRDHDAALASAPVAGESPMAKMADALREKARQEQQAYQDRRNQATEWGPMPDGTEADRPIPSAPVAHVAGDETSRYLEWAKDRSAWEMPVGTPVYYSALASAPVAGEARTEGGDPASPRDDSDRTYDKPIGYLPAYELGRLHSGHSANLRSAKFGPSALDGDVPVYLEPPNGDAAPQASAENVRNAALDWEAAWRDSRARAAALEEAATAVEARIGVGEPGIDTQELDRETQECANAIRALKPQADKDGGQQRAGDVDERAAFEAWAYRAGMGPKFRESMFAAWEARAALSAPQAEQGERDA